MKNSIIIKNQIEEIERLADFINGISEQVQLSADENMSLNLALEEIVSNIILYAYPPDTDEVIHINVDISDDDELTFEIVDSGKEFDPTQAPEADINLSLEERPIGGLGIFIVRNIMDDVSYQRSADKNILTLRKQFKK